MTSPHPPAGPRPPPAPFTPAPPRPHPPPSPPAAAAITGAPCSSPRTRGSNASPADPAGFLSYFGGPSLAKAARTVFLEIPSVRAIALTGISSARCSLRISAQSSTVSTHSLPPAHQRARRSPEGVTFQPPIQGQFSPVADTQMIPAQRPQVQVKNCTTYFGPPNLITRSCTYQWL